MKEEKLIQLLTSYIFEKRELFSGKVFDEILDDEVEIKNVWASFFAIAKDDPDNHANICKDLESFVKDEKFDFTEDHNITVADYECYLKSVLRHIDSVVYGERFFSTQKDGKDKMAGSFLGQLKTRVKYYRKGMISPDDFDGALSRMNEAREKRNKVAGSHQAKTDYGKAMEAYIQAFFAATVVSNLIKNLGAGFKIEGVKGAKIVVLNEDGKELFSSTDNTLTHNVKNVVLSKSAFGELRKLNVLIKISAADCVTQQVPLIVNRGKFLERPSRKIKLLRQGMKEKKDVDHRPAMEAKPQLTEEPSQKEESLMLEAKSTSQELPFTHQLILKTWKWMLFFVVGLFSFIIWSNARQDEPQAENVSQNNVTKEDLSNLCGYYTYAESNGNSFENIQSAKILQNGSSYRLQVMADNGEQEHLFRIDRENQLKSETLGEGEVCKDMGKLVITFKNNGRLWIIQRTSML